MDTHELFLACRRGDLEKVRYLVEKKEISLNVRDKWDSSPLYYACFCGYKELVQYLIDNGARCEANTFDGERCIYGALTDEIRNFLRSAKMVTPRIMIRHTYDEFLRKIYESTEFTDVVVVTVDGTEFPCHKCILARRSPFLRNAFAKDPNCSRLMLTFGSAEHFQCLKEFMYTGRMRMVLEDDKVTEIQEMAERLQMGGFVDKLFEELDKYECERSRYLKQVQHIIIEPEMGCTELSEAFGGLADENMRRDLVELPFGSKEARSPLFTDVCFQIEDVQFFGHKIFYCNRSEYFAALLRDHFKETAKVGNIPLIMMTQMSPSVFSCIHDYVYRDDTDRLNESNVFDVLHAADAYLLNGLKRICGNFLDGRVDKDNALELLSYARVFQLARLEDQCALFMSKNLEHFIDNQEFHMQVIEDAEAVKERQETDSIAIVDDIRYHISANVQTFSEIEEANERLFLIDQLLIELGLEA